ncbi:MAG: sulfite exporter TauE/SafE family protein [Actinomycetaceae bacterium]|nr:sulfite exporter TauE/SafE family protein [Actinomycetaceae bacterium]
MDLALIVIAVLGIAAIGSVVQSIAGMGFGLVATPVFVALFGPTEGVLWGNIVGMTTSAALLFQKWRDIDWNVAIRFTVASIPVIFATVFLTKDISRPVLNAVIGAIMLVMVAFAVMAPKLPKVEGRLPMYITGVLGGFLSASVSQAGPVMAAYARASQWPQKNFAATLQVYFLAMNFVNIPLKLSVGFGPKDSTIGWATFIAALVGIGVGTEVARRVAQRITPKQARTFAMAIATVGASWVIVQGITGLIS